MKRLACLAVLALAACAPPVAERGYGDPGAARIGQGVGLGADYGMGYGEPTYDGSFDGASSSGAVISADELRAAGLPAGGASAGLPATDPVTSAPLDARAPVSVPASAGGVNAASSRNVGISDEQSFEAVSARETIESDAQRLARQAAAYTVIRPTAVPRRSGAEGPNIVSFALSTSNRVGEPLYRRGGIGGGRGQRACARYPSPDLAQEAFLEQGGPQRDRLGLDPDGDGFACAWDPAPFRAARR
ncbi:hypothetical protein [Palleronia aestuarii]|nr:hypothetical protein [Palleronia aestuarii]